MKSFFAVRYMALLVALLPASSEPLKTRNVFLIVSDGLRWQEVFDGAQQELLNSQHGGRRNDRFALG